MFSSRFMLFPAFKKEIGCKKIHFTFYANFNINKKKWKY